MLMLMRERLFGWITKDSGRRFPGRLSSRRSSHTWTSRFKSSCLCPRFLQTERTLQTFFFLIFLFVSVLGYLEVTGFRISIRGLKWIIYRHIYCLLICLHRPGCFSFYSVCFFIGFLPSARLCYLPLMIKKQISKFTVTILLLLYLN